MDAYLEHEIKRFSEEITTSLILTQKLDPNRQAEIARPEQMALFRLDLQKELEHKIVRLLDELQLPSFIEWQEQQVYDSE
jgi:hypothetical protein